MQRNIWIVYALTFLRNSWFWLGVWIFYYLRFTNYAGIGLIEMFLFFAATISEVPTGVIADFFGKKQTLAIAFVLSTIGMGFLAFAPHFSWVLGGAIIGGVGNAFYSGTADALLYDTLKENDAENKFDKIISKVTSISLIAPAMCGLIGGFLYNLHPSTPFVISTFFYALGIPLTLFLIEPTVKSEKVLSFYGFIQQAKDGFRELFKNTTVIEQSITLIVTGTISVICTQMLNDFLGVQFGFQPAQLAIVWSFLYIVCSGASYTTSYINRFMSYKTIAIIVGVVIAMTLIVSPFIGVGELVLAGIVIGVRAIAQTLFENTSSILVNQNTESEYRTTTLSTFNLLKTLPYAFTAYFLGTLTDKSSSMHVAFFLGIILLVFIALQAIFYGRKRVRFISNII